MLANDERGLAAVTVAFVQRPVSSGLNLHHRGRNPGGQILKRPVHLPQNVRIVGNARVGRTLSGRLRLVRCFAGLRLARTLLRNANSAGQTKVEERKP